MELNEVNVSGNDVPKVEANNHANGGEKKRGGDILYGIDDIPPWYLSIPMAFQVDKTLLNNKTNANVLMDKLDAVPFFSTVCLLLFYHSCKLIVCIKYRLFAALFDDDRCHRFDTIHSDTGIVHGKRGSGPWTDYIDHDFRYRPGDIRAGHLGLPFANCSRRHHIVSRSGAGHSQFAAMEMSKQCGNGRIVVRRKNRIMAIANARIVRCDSGIGAGASIHRLYGFGGQIAESDYTVDHCAHGGIGRFDTVRACR